MATGDISYIDLQARAQAVNAVGQISQIDLVAQSVATTPATVRISQIELVAAASATPVYGVISAIDLTTTRAAPVSTTAASISYIDLTTSSLAPPPDAAYAGKDVTVEPFGTYTLVGTGSAVGVWSLGGGTGQLGYSQDGTVFTYTPVPSLAGSTFTAVYTVGSVSDSVTIKVYPIAERVVMNGSEQPMQWRETA